MPCRSLVDVRVEGERGRNGVEEAVHEASLRFRLVLFDRGPGGCGGAGRRCEGRGTGGRGCLRHAVTQNAVILREEVVLLLLRDGEIGGGRGAGQGRAADQARVP